MRMMATVRVPAAGGTRTIKDGSMNLGNLGQMNAIP